MSVRATHTRFCDLCRKVMPEPLPEGYDSMRICVVSGKGQTECIGLTLDVCPRCTSDPIYHLREADERRRQS